MVGLRAPPGPVTLMNLLPLIKPGIRASSPRPRTKNRTADTNAGIATWMTKSSNGSKQTKPRHQESSRIFYGRSTPDPRCVRGSPMATEASTPPRFFVLKHEKWGTHDVEFTGIDDNVGKAAKCPRCGDFIGSLPWLPPYRGTLELYGKDPGDFIRGSGGEVLISERLAESFRAEGLTGLRGFHPVEVLRVRRQRRGPKPPTTIRYLVVTPVFGSAAVDEARNCIRRDSPITCDWCRETGVDSIHGFVLEPGSWNGDDVFVARGMPGSIVVSERFADFVARHGFTNMKLTPTEEYTWDPLRRGPPPSTPGGQASSGGAAGGAAC